MSRAVQSSPRGAKLASAPPQWIFFVIFTISGFSGLIYESIWSHYLKLFLGHAAYAQSLVLIIFMGGLALGSWLTARFSERFRLPILVYAIVEGTIGVIALLFHNMFVSVSDAFYFSILPSLDAPALGSMLKWSAAALMIVPQSVLLGMTFPLMTSGIIRRYPDQPGGTLSLLYFTNSIGAAIGVLVSGFWLIGVVGLPGAIMTAGLLNIALALTVWILVKLDPTPDAAPTRTAAGSTATRDDQGLARVFFIAAAVTGAASFIYEIGWIRMLSLVLGGTTHSFELMLSAFITGLAFGGLWIKRRIDRVGNPVRFAGWVQVLMGAMAVLTIPLYVQTFDWMAALLTGLQKTDVGYNLFTAMSHGIALAVMVPTTFLAGMTLPLFTHVLMRGPQGERAIGRVYAANTLGAIVGILFAMHVGLPVLGLKLLIAFGAALDIGLGIVLLQRSAAGHSGAVVGTLRGALVGAAALIVVVATVDLDPKRLASGVYRYMSAELSAETEVIYYRDGKTASISLFARGSQIAISTNGKPDAALEMDLERLPARDEITMIMAGALPLAYNPNARVAANIGLGSGLTTHTLLGHPDIERVDTVEIEPAMVEGARGFGDRVARTFGDPRSHIHVEDAKTFFSLHNTKYDIIVAEPSNPWVSGVASLFSEEFYRNVRNYLDDDGVLVQWLQLYEFNDELALSVLRALDQNFSDFAIFNTDDTNILIVAKPEGTLEEPRFDGVFSGELAGELARVGLRSAEDFLVRNTANRPMIHSLLAASRAPANSDYFPFLDLNAGRARFRGDIAAMFHSWASTHLPVLEMVGPGHIELGRVTSNLTFQRTQLIENAEVLRDAFLAAPDHVDDVSKLVTINPLVSTLKLLRGTCASGVDESDWIPALHVLAEQTLPFLDAHTGAELLDAAWPPACRLGNSERLAAWHALYLAVARRNAGETAAAAHRVLEVDPESAPQRTVYVLTAAMLGHVANGHRDAALALWDEHKDSVAGIATPPDLQLLIQLARDGEPAEVPNLVTL